MGTPAGSAVASLRLRASSAADRSRYALAPAATLARRPTPAYGWCTWSMRFGCHNLRLRPSRFPRRASHGDTVGFEVWMSIHGPSARGSARPFGDRDFPRHASRGDTLFFFFVIIWYTFFLFFKKKVRHRRYFLKFFRNF